MQEQGFEKFAEVIHRDVLVQRRQQREQAAKSATITADNRNLSQAWSQPSATTREP